jgi:fructose-1,6-bisphosphatase/inositol monophosphatase family enzyme
MNAMFGALQSIMKRRPHAVRQLGSGVLDLCYVACGRLDAVYTGVAGEGWKPWDYCAGILLITEAGGVVRTIENDAFHVDADSLVAAGTDELMNDLMSAVRSFKISSKKK